MTAQLLVQHLNQSGNEIIAIDIPSGLFVNRSSRDNVVIHAAHTLSFQCYKPAFLMPENARLPSARCISWILACIPIIFLR
jgi:NAD(P)H-hydrate repair Nnr-like enzyme with NAD(P)H-hydrate epimerase domain